MTTENKWKCVIEFNQTHWRLQSILPDGSWVYLRAKARVMADDESIEHYLCAGKRLNDANRSQPYYRGFWNGSGDVRWELNHIV